LSAEREGRVFPVDGNLHHFPMICSGSSAQSRRERQGFMMERFWGEREWRGSKWMVGEGSREGFGLYTPG
jgi:CO dehydrogenase/acetyl-CoA synthase delta subunit